MSYLYVPTFTNWIWLLRRNVIFIVCKHKIKLTPPSGFWGSIKMGWTCAIRVFTIFEIEFFSFPGKKLLQFCCLIFYLFPCVVESVWGMLSRYFLWGLPPFLSDVILFFAISLIFFPRLFNTYFIRGCFFNYLFLFTICF